MNIETEHGSEEPIGFWNPQLYDGNNNRVEIPSCKTCGQLMQIVIRRECCAWICLEGHNQEK